MNVPDDPDDALPLERRLDPHSLQPADHRAWLERLWEDTCLLQRRFRLPLRTGWWEDWVQVEAMAATAAWVRRYDEGEWDDPPGKLALLFDLERVGVLLREGHGPFDPVRDRPAFEQHLECTMIRVQDAAQSLKWPGDHASLCG